MQGVCPQHDLLWVTLTAREHLNFYGRLKRLTGPALTAAVDATLRSVNLSDVANKRSGQFSGGAPSLPGLGPSPCAFTYQSVARCSSCEDVNEMCTGWM